MIRLSGLTDIARLYTTHGALNYGEGVTQMEHALQSAALAEAQACPPSLVAASLLHDIGHLFEKEDEVAGFTVDHRHEVTGAEALANLFGDAVCQPIALHVAAKRYLCFQEPAYLRGLSAASKRSLALQGGPFDAVEAHDFEQLPYWRDAVLLRRFDDMGKRDDLSLGHFEKFTPLLLSLLIDTPKA
jgi:phosphonate degradation associated HDIG domain protein